MKTKKKSKYTLLEEVAAVIRFQITGCEDAKKLLFEQYEGLVRKQAHRTYSKSRRYNVNFDDLVSEGFIGLLTAMKKHNVFRCDKMYPTASFYILEAINCCAMDSMSLTRKMSTNSNGRKLYNKYGKTLAEHGYASPLTQDQVTTVASSLSVKPHEIEFMENILGPESELDDSIINWRSNHDHETVDDDLDNNRILSIIRTRFLDTLSEKERDIAMRRILTDEPEKAQDLAAEYGVSPSSIYQTEKRVSMKLISMARKEMNIDVAA